MEQEKQTQKYPEPDQAFPTQKESKWVNKQRTLVVSSRGISDRQRHLMFDLIDLMPHSKKEAKLEKKDIPSQITELCFIHSCSNFIYFETRKRSDLYVWMGKFPNGPSVKFLVENIHTSQELKLTGNCVKGSRPILSFDQSFKEDMQLKLMREIFVHAFNIPRYHPKSKPTVDHIYSFVHTDKKIWFRNYQIATEDLSKDAENQELYEIGPRFVLNPICILSGAMNGEVLYKNPDYKTKTKLSSERKRMRREQMLLKAKKAAKHQKIQNQELKHDPVDDLFEVNNKLDSDEDNKIEEDQQQGSSYESLDDEDDE